MELTDKEFVQLRDYLKQNFGINLSNEKKGLVYSRLRARVQSMDFSFDQYYKMLISDKTNVEKQFFINLLSTNHTFFWREPAHFICFKEQVCPWLEYNVRDKDVRIWCAASSSGEEPYTMQMILHEYFKHKPGWDVRILATDVSDKVLNKAVEGVYSKEAVSTLPDSIRVNYFTKFSEENVQVIDEIRRLVIFRKFNLMDEVMPFKKSFHVIFCRNVMIYFDSPSQAALVKRFYDKTVEGGYLFIGHAESLSQMDVKYKYFMPSGYRKE
jgi:chemotaxis protein methyltransferase CheR